jgi:hypothetical protein
MQDSEIAVNNHYDNLVISSWKSKTTQSASTATGSLI